MGIFLHQRIAESGFGSFIRRIAPQYKLQKISVNTGHACPNQDGTLGRGGCTYCVNAAFSPLYTLSHQSITKQLEAGKQFFAKKYPSMHYLAYFQSYTSTHTQLSLFIDQCEEALRVPLIEGLVISTRPDCISQPLLDYLSSLKKRGVFILVEYGVESTHDHTLDRIHRCHTYHEAEEAIRQTAASDLLVGAHIILGLPGETIVDYPIHARRLSKLPLSLIKLHQLQILRGTPIAEEYKEHPERFHLASVEQYADSCLDFIANLREDIALDRFIAQAPSDMVIAPQWGMKNYQFHSLLLKKALALRE